VFGFARVQIEAEKYGESLKEQEETYEKVLEDLEVKNLILESKIRNLELEYRELELENKALELEIYSYWLGREVN